MISMTMASAIGTGIFCGIWQGLAGVLGLVSWMGFVGCTSYFSAGCGKTGFIKSLCSNFTGVLWGMLIILSGNINSTILFGAIVTGFFSWVICYQSKISLLSLVPNTFMGGFATFASGGSWKMLLLCLVLGNILGVVCDYSGRYIFKMFGKKEEVSQAETTESQ